MECGCPKTTNPFKPQSSYTLNLDLCRSPVFGYLDPIVTDPPVLEWVFSPRHVLELWDCKRGSVKVGTFLPGLNPKPQTGYLYIRSS